MESSDLAECIQGYMKHSNFMDQYAWDYDDFGLVLVTNDDVITLKRSRRKA